MSLFNATLNENVKIILLLLNTICLLQMDQLNNLKYILHKEENWN